MIEFKAILDSDPDEGVDWARRLPTVQVSKALDFYLGILGDQDQEAARRVNAASVLNALGSAHSLPRGAATQAFGLIPTLAREEDEDIRRTGMSAVSSLLHSLSRHAPAASLPAYDQFLKALAPEMPGAWEKGVLASIRVAFQKKYLRPDSHLASVVGKKPRSRDAWHKATWDYVVTKGLFDSRSAAIRPDAKLKRIVGGRARITKAELSKYVGQHLLG